MNTTTEIKEFLIRDLADRLRDYHPTAPGDTYFGRYSREDRKASEIFLYFRGRDTRYEGLGTGRLIATSVAIELYKAQTSPYESDSFQGDLEQAARLLVEAYDDAVALFASSLSASVDAVKCSEVTDIEESARHGEMRRVELTQTFLLEVTTWEDRT